MIVLNGNKVDLTLAGAAYWNSSKWVCRNQGGLVDKIGLGAKVIKK